jgi:Uma2 family endonuclease
MSAREFRAFQAERPDHERWELIGGVATMMTPPTIAHNRIAGNLERLLNAGLAMHDPSRFANQRPGVEPAHVPAKWSPVRRQEHAPLSNSRIASSDSSSK